MIAWHNAACISSIKTSSQSGKSSRPVNWTALLGRLRFMTPGSKLSSSFLSHPLFFYFDESGNKLFAAVMGRYSAKSFGLRRDVIFSWWQWWAPGKASFFVFFIYFLPIELWEDRLMTCLKEDHHKTWLPCSFVLIVEAIIKDTILLKRTKTGKSFLLFGKKETTPALLISRIRVLWSGGRTWWLGSTVHRSLDLDSNKTEPFCRLEATYCPSGRRLNGFTVYVKSGFLIVFPTIRASCTMLRWEVTKRPGVG